MNKKVAKRRRYKKRKTASKTDIAVAILIILSILLAVLIYTKSGIIGTKLNEILGGILGIVEYILPIGIFAVGIKLACDGKDNITPKLVQYVVLVLCLCVFFSVLQISMGELHTNSELSDIVKEAYNIGTKDARRRSYRCGRSCATN